MKILLVAPRNPESFWTFDRILPVLGKACVFPNLALPTVAALTPEGHEITLCDENAEPIDFDVDADLVALTGYLVHRQRMREIADAFRRHGKRVVVGGPYASLCPDEVREWADAVFVGEAESTWPRFVQDYASGQWSSLYEGEIPDVRTSPCPRFDGLWIERYRAMTVQFSRGCPYDCEFCDVSALYGRRPRTKSTDQFLRELEALRRLGVTNVFVTDDNFVGNRKEVKPVLRELAAWQERHRWPVELLTQVSLNVAADEELLHLLRRANFTALFIGIESPRPASLEEAHKRHNLKGDMIAAVHTIQSFGIDVMAGMIVGFDNDDADVFEEHRRFIEEAAIPVSMTGMLNAIPGTALYRRLCEAGRLLPQSLGDQFAFTNIVPAGMSRVELYEGYRRLLRRLYSYRSYRKRVLRALFRRPSDGAGGKITIRREDVRIFLRTLWSCVVRASPGRSWMTLSLLGQVALRRPRALRSAVGLALVHRHLHGYVSRLSKHLDTIVREMRARERALARVSAAPVFDPSGEDR